MIVTVSIRYEGSEEDYSCSASSAFGGVMDGKCDVGDFLCAARQTTLKAMDAAISKGWLK